METLSARCTFGSQALKHHHFRPSVAERFNCRSRYRRWCLTAFKQNTLAANAATVHCCKMKGSVRYKFGSTRTESLAEIAIKHEAIYAKVLTLRLGRQNLSTEVLSACQRLSIITKPRLFTAGKLQMRTTQQLNKEICEIPQPSINHSPRPHQIPNTCHIHSTNTWHTALIKITLAPPTSQQHQEYARDCSRLTRHPEKEEATSTTSRPFQEDARPSSAPTYGVR